MDAVNAPVEVAAAPLPGEQLTQLLTEGRQRPRGLAELVGNPAVVLTGWSQVKEFLSDDSQEPGALYRFQIEPVTGSTFINLDGRPHDLVRRLATPAFRSRAVSRFVDHSLVPLAHEVVDRFAARGEADLVAELADVLPFWAISRKLGLPRRSEDHQRDLARAMLSYPAAPEAAVAAGEEVRGLVEPVLAERRRKPTDDVLSRLVTAEHDGERLSDDDIVAHVRLLYAVGATTTSDAMSSLLRNVLHDPGLPGRARHDPDLRSRIVTESLRTDPAVAMLPRLAARGGTFGGVDLEPNTLVLAAIAAANRDPHHVEDADRFDPDRAEREVLTFGFGSKFCPGSHLGRQQLAAALGVLLERLDDISLVHADEPTGAILRRVPSVRARWTVR